MWQFGLVALVLIVFTAPRSASIGLLYGQFVDENGGWKLHVLK